MTLLKNALLENSTLKPLVQTGMGAFSPADKALIAREQRPRVGDSLDLDRAMQPKFPQQNRWDYLLSVPDASLVIAIEPHTAGDHEIKVVIKKRRQALDYLRLHLQQKYRVSSWLWVSRGRPMFSRMERAQRQLAAAGIKYVGRTVVRLE